MSDVREGYASAEIRFLENLQLLLAESRTNSTYKYALLIAIADICIEDVSTNDRAELTIPVTRIAEKFLEIYWRHGMPYGAGSRDSAGGVLSQNRGGQAMVIRKANALREAFVSPAVARRRGPWQRTTMQLVGHLKEMPLWRLQRLRTTTLDFLYPEEPDRDEITLRPGVAAAFRRFHTLVVRLVQAEWMAFLYSLPGNQVILGNSGDLADFLFGPQRESLAKIRPALNELQQGACFYCRGHLTGTGEIDHFIPWSRYPRNFVHNLVLAHRSCNGAKSDLLGGEVYLGRWAEFVSAHDADLLAIGTEAGLLVDRATSVAVAEWSYGHAERLHAEVWLGGNEYGHLSTGWRELLAISPNASSATV